MDKRRIEARKNDNGMIRELPADAMKKGWFKKDYKFIKYVGEEEKVIKKEVTKKTKKK